jgi:DNA-directed RNA polymerase subunit beta'
MIDRFYPEVWGILERVINERPVLLNRAPTLHRLGIQAFEPKLIEGKAIQLHPLVCSAFNADFDGDQMAVHLPLSVEAQAESRILMLSNNNILKLSDGRPVTLPTLDMVMGIYHMTSIDDENSNPKFTFSSLGETIMAYDRDDIGLNTKVNIISSDGIKETTYGRALFNNLLPDDYPFVNETLDKSKISEIVNDLTNKYPNDVITETLDNLKEAGFYWCTRSALTFGMDDIKVSTTKEKILSKYDKQAATIQDQYDSGMMTDEEKTIEMVNIWTSATEEVDSATQSEFDKNNSLYKMVVSGTSGNWMQIRQIAGIRGLVVDTKGNIIPRPIKSNYYDGMSVAEFFTTTHGARKGLADTALRTADSGYLTRRLVDVSQDIIVREEDCETSRGINIPLVIKYENGSIAKHPKTDTSVVSRVLAVDVVNKDGKIIANRGSIVTRALVDKMIKAGIESVKVRSVLTCEARYSVCAHCYGYSFATSKMVEVGDSVGVIAAQSIGEPGTQLTLRTFKTGGDTTADDITQGLPRVQELFEARNPKGESPIAEISGRVEINETDRLIEIKVKPNNADEKEKVYGVSKRSHLLVDDGQEISIGTQLIEGVIDPKKLLEISGTRAVQDYLVKEVQDVYSSQGVEIHNKHIEIIVRQMLKMVTIIDPGDTDLLPGDMVSKTRFERANKVAREENKNPAFARPEILGITKASLGTESWLSAASFQETTKILTEAAINNKSDHLIGLKENVIIGKLIPAGTGFASS